MCFMGECEYNLLCLVLLGWAVVVGFHESCVFMCQASTSLHLVMKFDSIFSCSCSAVGSLFLHFRFVNFEIKDNIGLSNVNHDELTISLFQQMAKGGSTRKLYWFSICKILSFLLFLSCATCKNTTLTNERNWVFVNDGPSTLPCCLTRIQ
ncbi:hypothetical protein E2542_SST13121 [Spatholobus suberectus]|nr:hypothetical protein E2542_SST13121 [Spatholobus suberectus]